MKTPGHKRTAKSRKLLGSLYDRNRSILDKSEGDRYVALRQSLLRSAYLGDDARAFFSRHRYLQVYWARTASKWRAYAERDAFVRETFESTLERLQGEPPAVVELSEVTLQVLELTEVHRVYTVARKRLSDLDAPGAITLTRSLLESTAKQILDAYGVTYIKTDTPAALCRAALNAVKPPSMLGDEHFNRFCRVRRQYRGAYSPLSRRSRRRTRLCSGTSRVG